MSIRDSRGRYVKGHPGGPGRKSRKQEEAYLSAMVQVCDEEAWEAIVQRATQDAIDGDAKARAWLSGYMLGQPVSRVEANPKSKLDSILDRLEQAHTEHLDAVLEQGDEEADE